ncbi:MAG: hypothetical protein WAO71_06225 [Gallionella sp.]
MLATDINLSAYTLRRFFILLLAIDVITGAPRYFLGVKNPIYIFVVIVLFSFAVLLRNAGILRLIREERYLVTVTLVFWGIGLWGVLVGVFRGNDFRHIINDGASFLIYPAYLIIWIGLFSGGKSALISLHSQLNFFIGISSLACITYVLALMFFPNPISLMLLDMVDNTHINVFKEYVQVFFISLSFMVPLSFALIAKFNGLRVSKVLKLTFFTYSILVFVLIIVSYVRIFWLLLAFGLVVYFFSFGKRFSLFLSMVICGFFVIMSLSFGQIEIGEIIMHRIETIFDSSQSSNEMKLFQVPYLWNEALESPILGNGFGMHLSFIRSITEPYTYEVDLVAMAAKLGLVVFAVFCGIFVWVMVSFIRLFRRFSKMQMEFEAGVALFGFLSTFYWLVIDLSNPYLNSPLGMFYLYFFFSILTLLRKRYSELRIEK